MQSAYDADATYRDKAGKSHSGYVLNISETCAKENPVQFITDYTLQPNNASDVNIAKERLPKIKENTDVTDIYVDGGYYGEEVLEKAHELEIDLHYTDMTGRKAPKDKLPTTCFTFDDEMKVLSCPQGKTPLRSNYDSKKKVSSSHFSHDDCKGCPVFDICPVKSQRKPEYLGLVQRLFSLIRLENNYKIRILNVKTPAVVLQLREPTPLLREAKMPISLMYGAR